MILLPVLIFAIYFVIQSEKKIKENHFFKDQKTVFVLLLGSIFIWLLNATFVFDIFSFFESGNTFHFLPHLNDKN